MAIQTDYLLRIIERLGEAIAKLVAGGDTSEAESALEEITGLSLDRAAAEIRRAVKSKSHPIRGSLSA